MSRYTVCTTPCRKGHRQQAGAGLVQDTQEQPHYLLRGEHGGDGGGLPRLHLWKIYAGKCWL
jgi:hypothetical protein